MIRTGLVALLLCGSSLVGACSTDALRNDVAEVEEHGQLELEEFADHALTQPIAHIDLELSTKFQQGARVADPTVFPLDTVSPTAFHYSFAVAENVDPNAVIDEIANELLMAGANEVDGMPHTRVFERRSGSNMFVTRLQAPSPSTLEQATTVNYTG